MFQNAHTHICTMSKKMTPFNGGMVREGEERKECMGKKGREKDGGKRKRRERKRRMETHIYHGRISTRFMHME